MNKIVTLATIFLLFVATPAQRRRTPGIQPSRSPTPTSANHFVVLTGQCRFQLIRGFSACDSKVMFARLANGRSLVTFVKDQTIMFTLSGGPDRQPNLENYFLGIDTFRITKGNDDEVVDNAMEGECHFHMNKTATKFFFVKCDIYNRAKGTIYNFYLKNITKTVHRAS
jgi:hypothetical protein